MEKITFNITTDKKKQIRVRYRLRDGRKVQLCHKSSIVADAVDIAKFNPDGTTRTRVSVFNQQLAADLTSEYLLMTKAYASMKENGYDMTSEVFEVEISKLKDPIVQTRIEKPNVVTSFRMYADKALKHGIIGNARHRHIMVVADKLERFLIINGIRGMTIEEFNADHLMDFRDFIFDEYKYIKRYPKLYDDVKEQNKPQARLSMNTVVSQMKMLQTFFTELEDTDEISKSPFRKLGKERKKTVMKTKYDDPIFLRDDELFTILGTEVPPSLQDTKDAFLVQCAFGCRVSDFQKMDMNTISVSEDGIPYVHYIPQKTADAQTGNEEIQTPIVRYAFDIIKRTGFVFPILNNLYGKNGYNSSIKYLLRICKIDRKVAQYNEETRQNEYFPLYSAGSSKLCRKTHVDMMNKVQVDMYAAGLHKEGSLAVNRYTKLELKDRFALLNAAFKQEPYKVNTKMNITL